MLRILSYNIVALIMCKVMNCKGKGKGKVIPLQARCDPEGG